MGVDKLEGEPHCLDLYNTYSDLSHELISYDLYVRFLIPFGLI